MKRVALTVVLAVAVIPSVARGPAKVGAASPTLADLKAQLQQEIASGQAQLGPDQANAVRQRLGLPPVTVVHGPPPAGGMSQPNVMGYGQAPPTQVSTGPANVSGTLPSQPTAQSGNWYWVSMNKWVEPDGGNGGSCQGNNGYSDPRGSHSATWYASLCGPGSSEAVVSNWNSNPSTYNGYYYYGYVATQGLHYLGYMFTIANEEMANSLCPEDTTTEWGTCAQTEANIINHEIASSYYQVDWCAGSIPGYNCSNGKYSNWTSDLNTDIATVGVPVVEENWTCSSGGQCLPGWPYRAEHFQAISQYDPTDSLDKYGETGNAADTCGSGYQNNMAPGVYNNSSWHDPVTGAYFNEQSGWDYVSNQFHWQRADRLIW